MGYYGDDGVPVPLNLKDEGTREKHCMELLELWEQGLFILMNRRPGLLANREAQMIVELTHAIGLLKSHITGVNGAYNEMFYLREINKLPLKGEEIKDEEGPQSGM